MTGALSNLTWPLFNDFILPNVTRTTLPFLLPESTSELMRERATSLLATLARDGRLQEFPSGDTFMLKVLPIVESRLEQVVRLSGSALSRVSMSCSWPRRSTPCWSDLKSFRTSNFTISWIYLRHRDPFGILRDRHSRRFSTRWFKAPRPKRPEKISQSPPTTGHMHLLPSCNQPTSSYTTK